jgi:hypothetical protein
MYAYMSGDLQTGIVDLRKYTIGSFPLNCITYQNLAHITTFLFAGQY